MPQEEPSELSPVERLLRLKRYEKPEEDFVESFIVQFHERQRREMLRQSARGLLWERLVAYWGNLISPRRAFAVASVAALMVIGWMAMPGSQSSTVVGRLDLGANGDEGGYAAQFGVEGVLLGIEDDKPAVESSLLLSDHFSGGFADEARLARVSRSHSQGLPARETSVTGQVQAEVR